MIIKTRRGKVKRDKGCTGCRLHNTTHNVCIMGTGPRKAKIMIVGEAPGKTEEDGGEPFIGRAGKLLDRLLEDAGIDRADVYISNAVHCRPPDNKTPTKTEVRNCNPWLSAEIEAVQPAVVILLGNTPLLSITGQQGITKKRGKPFQQGLQWYVPTFHPAFALRDPNQEGIILSDFLTAKHVLDHGGIPEEERLNRELVLTEDDLDACIADLRRSKEISFDIETTSDNKDLGGLYPWADGARVVMMGFGTKRHQWSIPLQHPESPWADNDNYVVKRCSRIVRKKKLITHNGKFDMLYMLVRYGVRWKIWFDTMIAHFMYNENDRHGLKYLATKYCNAPNWDVDGDTKQGVGPLDKTARYHAHDLFYTRKLKFIIDKWLKQDNSQYRIYKKLLIPATNMFVKAEYHGVYINLDGMGAVEARLRKTVKDAETKLKGYADINWGSTQQVAKYLFEEEGLTPLDYTAKGAPSTSESVMKRLADQHPAPEALLELRGAQKQLSGFITSWYGLMDDNSRLHPNFKLTGTVTGRLSCVNPNLQQVPRDKAIRSLVTAPPGYKLVEADLSQVELRIAAEMSGDPELTNAFVTGGDPHWLTVMRESFRTGAYAKQIKRTARRYMKDHPGTAEKLDLPEKCGHSDFIEVMLHMGASIAQKYWDGWKEVRKKAKAINFGYLYGMWWKKFVMYARDNYGVKVTEAEAQESRESYFELYAALPGWHKRQKNFVRRNGYVRSLIGRKRRLPDAQVMGDDHKTKMKRMEAERQAINSPVQGFASDYNIMVALEVMEKYKHHDVHLVGTVHDAVLFEVPEDMAEEVGQYILKVMKGPKLLKEFDVKLKVPIEGDGGIGPWGDQVPLAA